MKRQRFAFSGTFPGERDWLIDMRPLHKPLFCLFALVVLSGTAAIAEKIASTARIVDKVDENQLVTLRGNTYPAANAQNDTGRVSPRLKMTDLILVLSRSPEQQAAFDAFVASQYDSTSPNFHQWLEPADIGAKFGPSLTDIATVSNWLAGHGFSVDEVAKDRMTIRFSGTAHQVESAFHTEIHNLSVKGEAHIGNMADPQIPMALDPVVVGVKALHNFFPRPMHRLGGKAKLNSETGKWERVAEANTARSGLHVDAITAHPEFGITVGSGSSAYQVEDVTPYDFAAIYNVLPLWSAGTPIDGTGQTIAIAGTSKINLSDVVSFRSIFGLPSSTPAPTETVANGTDPGICTGTTGNCTLDDQFENALDVEWAGAVAKNAHIVLVVSGTNSSTTDTVYASSNYVVQHNVAKIMNVSYGECELGLGTAGNTLYKNLWQTAATAGIAVFVASGDSGSPACDQGMANSTPYGAQYGLSVSGLASTQYNVAVGGTDLNWGATASPYWNSTNSATNGSSAKGYMPEAPWNDSCTNPLVLSYLQSAATFLHNNGFSSAKSPTDAESACNFVATWSTTINILASVDLSWLVNTVGAGGGKSNCINGDGSTVASCTQGYAKPSFQSTSLTGMPNDSARDIPDVSFFASNGFLGSAYLVCVSASGACVSSTTITTEPFAQEVGGTSASSPAMAGVMALINQKAGSTQGNPNSELYTLAGQQTYSSCKTETGTTSDGCYFNDVDTGTIAMACAAGSPNCTVATSGDTYGVLSGYGATVGFDRATGLGSLNVANVVNSWTSSIGTATATVTVTPASSSIISNVALTVTGTVAGSSGTPTGSVVLTGGGYTSSAAILTSGAYTITIPANSLSGGTDTLTVTYNGDATYAVATGTATVTVTTYVPLTPTVAVTPAASTLFVGDTLGVTGSVTGSNGTPTGTVKLTGGSYTSANQTLTSGAFSFKIPANMLPAGTDVLTATYSGDNIYGTASATASVTVTASAFSLTASTPTAVSAGGSTTSTITGASTTDYTGSVSLACTLTSSPAGAADLPHCSMSAGSPMTFTTGAPGATATASVSTTAKTATLVKPRIGGWQVAGEGAVLALLMFFGIPARRRGWRAMLGVLVLTIALGSLAACGGGGGSTTKDPGTTAGAYTFTVTGTGTPSEASGNTVTFAVTVN